MTILSCNINRKTEFTSEGYTQVRIRGIARFGYKDVIKDLDLVMLQDKIGFPVNVSSGFKRISSHYKIDVFGTHLDWETVDKEVLVS